MKKELVSISKFVSLVLRHRPEAIGLTLDKEGWADVADMLKRMSSQGSPVTKEMLDEVVATNEKKRFAYNDDETKIRASQGHSIEVDLKLVPADPPIVLYHGTATRFVMAITKEGLKPMSRQHVHLSDSPVKAIEVGKRHGKPFVFKVDARRMFENGHVFYCSENGVWLTNEVPAQYLFE